MYDNTDFRLRKSDAIETNFMETARYFDVTGEHYFDGEPTLTGTLEGNFKITVNRGGVNIKGGSLCKWYLGDNFSTMQRSDTKRAIERLSDVLHLPIQDATVSRIDIAANLILKNPIEVYYNHLGEWRDSNKKCKRSQITEGSRMEGLYYFQNNGLLVFYDKVKEQKAKQQPVPELFQKGRNVLRYEQRYTSRLPKAFNVERVTGRMLYDEKFYMKILDEWKSNYFKINKINDITINLTGMKGIKDFNRMGILCMLEMFGGEIALKEQVKEAQKVGTLSKDAAFDIRKAIENACKVRDGLTVKNDCISELDKVIKEAVKFCR